MTVTAHAGAFDTPANTMESVKKILEKKSEVIELDVTFRPDKTPVIIHSGEPSENEGVPLDEVFSVISSDKDIQMNLDLKSIGNLPETEALLKKHGLFGRAFYTGAAEDWCAVLQKSSNVPYYLNLHIKLRQRRSKKVLLKEAEKAVRLGVCGINVKYCYVTQKLVDIMHKHSLPVSVWTVNNPKTAKKLIKMGVDNITSLDPDVIKALLNK
ncbi:MAG: glycerophosphodiester phosphodiesterase [Clostridiales bacterium]|nr:glycerophosphodiester phosphodiesterase [Clostridiales bacterium]